MAQACAKIKSLQASKTDREINKATNNKEDGDYSHKIVAKEKPVKYCVEKIDNKITIILLIISILTIILLTIKVEIL